MSKYLIEIKNVTPTMYYSGYEIIDKVNCPSGETEAVLYKFTEDVYSAKQLATKKLADALLPQLPMHNILTTKEHIFG